MPKPFFEEVNIKANFPEMENKLLDSWYKDEVVEKYLHRNKSSEKYFSFLDGPITANNPMGVHHAWGRTYKDLWQRFKNMQGYKQRFQNGFDCQGLWVEVEVEKELGLRSKKDIENLVPGDRKASIAKFVELCKQRVQRYADIQTHQSKRLGYFMDWDNSYFTLSDENNYMIWQFLKKCFDKKLIYKGRDSVPWCPRCGTAISQHEMLTEDYKEVSHESVFFALPVKNKDYSLLVWTTTPWTIPANVAVAVHPDYYYRVWKHIPSGKKYVILHSDNKGHDFGVHNRVLPNLFGGSDEFEHENNLKDVLGAELVKEMYSGPFDELPVAINAKSENIKTFHRIIPAKELVTTEEGTGLVHIAPGAGTEDFSLGKEFNLPVIAPIDEEAVYYDGFGYLSGKNAKKHPELVIDYLKKEKPQYFAAVQNYTHRYPACWRCKTELVWRVVDEWYIAIDPVRDDMKNVTKKVRWIPQFGLKRELDWLKNMHDWLISKKRYWGLALPIWACESCENFEVIGSKEELKEKSTKGWDKFEGHSPHKPWIDEIEIKCLKCGGVAKRIPDVGNPWLDAGIVSYSTISEDNKSTPLYWKDKNAWEKWFPADFITESFPGQFKNWFYSLIAMSTVMENKEPFKRVLGFATLLAEDGRPMHKSWGNAIEFNEGAEKIGVDVMRWMYVRQNPSENLLFGYKVADEIRRRFYLKIWNIYNYFVTYANLDSWKPKGEYKLVKNAPVLDRWIISCLVQLIEEVTANLEDFNAYAAGQSLEMFVEDFSNWYIRRSRSRTGQTSLSEVDKDSFYFTCHYILVTLSTLLAPLMPFISDVIYKNLTKNQSVHLADWPESKFDKDDLLLSEMQKVREIVESAHSIRKENGIAVRQPLTSLSTSYLKPQNDLEDLIKDEVNVKNIIWGGIKGKTLKVTLDTKITPLLEEEANVRQLIRLVQEERKKMGINLIEKVTVTNEWLPKSKALIQMIKKITLATNLHEGPFEVKKV